MSGHTRTAAAVRVCVMTAVFGSGALIEAARCSSVMNLAGESVWWHLRSGLWMLGHHALPHAGIFSQLEQAKWVATSWAYDLKLAVLYRLVGLRAVPIFALWFKAALAVVVFLLAGGKRNNFWPAIVVSTIAQYVLGAMPPTPVYCSAILLGVELLLLLAARRDLMRVEGSEPREENRQGAGAAGSGLRWMVWLPLVFLVWANVDIHFVYGIALLAVFAGAATLEKWIPADRRHARERRTLALVAAGCFVATLITPYFYRPYGVFFSGVMSPVGKYLPGYSAPGFRQPQDYVLVLFAMAAFLALGTRRSRDAFLMALLVLSAGFAFYSQRDIWLLVLAASAVFGEMMSGWRDAATEDARGLHFRDIGAAVAATIVVLAITAAFVMPRSEKLLAKAGTTYPVAAADFVRQHGLPQPVFNVYEWGGFLAWYLPEYPVAIDSRSGVYEDNDLVQYFKAMNAEIRYTDFSAMASAETLILPRKAIMADALGSLPAYKVAYRDEVAVVLTKKAEAEQENQ